MCQQAYLFDCLSFYQPACLPICLFVCPSVCFSTCLFVCLLSVYLFVFLPVCLSACLSFCLSALLSVSLFICLSVYLSVSLFVKRISSGIFLLSICLPVSGCLFVSLSVFLPICLSACPLVSLPAWLHVCLSVYLPASQALHLYCISMKYLLIKYLCCEEPGGLSVSLLHFLSQSTSVFGKWNFKWNLESNSLALLFNKMISMWLSSSL